MCGICGIYNLSGEAVLQSHIEKMNSVIRHRGPDDDGFFLEKNIALGHRRLSIIDLHSGKQPLYNEDKSLAIVFNGEIYNYQKLRKELLASGHSFETNTDTECIVHGYEEWGASVVERLRGMFAFAIWDNDKQELFLARDRLGIKPLFYYRTDRLIVFGSEIKAILQHPEVSRELNVEALDDYLSYLYIPAPKSIFKNIHKLLPGHFIRASLEKFLEREYWDVVFTSAPGSEQDFCEGIREKLNDAVSVRLMSDVPLGAFLSGGIDSSAVVATMSELSKQPVNTSSIGFNEAAYNELPYAHMVAERYGTNLHEKVVEAHAADILDILVWHFDEPFADSSMVPTYYVSQVAREQVTVCLSGDGGDENFAGYRRYKFDFLENRVRKLLPAFSRRTVFGTLGHVYPKADWLPQVFRAKTLFTNLALAPERGYYNSMRWFGQELKGVLYSEDIKRSLGNYDAFSVMNNYFDRVRDLDPLSRIQYVDIKTYLVDDILTKVDRASMAHALEVRVPLLDHEFIEYAASIPPTLKLRKGDGKYILKKALEGIVPNEILYRPKQGFSIPLAAWISGELREIFEDRIFSRKSFTAELFNVTQIRKLWEQHLRGTRDYASHLWALLILESWGRRFLS